MLNIISRSIYNNEVRGPKKVVENLIMGLKKINYPFKINGDLNSCKRLWIHDDISALKKISDLDSKIKTIIGPNLFILQEDIPKNIDISKVVYIQPSTWSKDLWIKLGFNKCPMESWPVGIDTDKHTPSSEEKNIVLVYFKSRNKKDLEVVENILKNKNILYKVMIYGLYHHKDYIETLKHTRYIILIDKLESQGIAFEEAMAMNIPLLVWDYKNIDFIKNKIDNLDINVSSVPYFDKRCGLIIENGSELLDNIDKMEKIWNISFKPREYILENLSLEKQAKDFIKLYEKHYGLSYESGFSEIKLNDKVWRNAKWYYQIYFDIKNLVKKIFYILNIH